MELTGLKHAINTGAVAVKESSSLNSSQSNSRTLEYKQIKNASQNASLPKFANGWANDFGGWGNQQFNNSLTAPLASVNNISMQSSPQMIQQGVQTGYTPGMFNTPGIDSPKENITPSTPAVVNQTPGQSAGGFKKVTSKGSGIGVSNIGGIVTSGVQFAGDAINAFSVNETGEDIAKQQGTSQMSIGGINYESQNSIDVSKELDKVKRQNTTNTLALMGSGAALGSVIPGLGTAVGAVIGAGVGLLTGIFGGEARKREYRRMLAKQNAKINALQDSSRYSAQTKAMQLQGAREYGNPEAQYLYGAANGKQPEVNPNTGMTKDNFLLATPNGYKIGKANSLVEPGETLLDTKTGSMMQVPRQIGSKLHPGDIQPAEIPEYAAVFTDRHEDPITGKSFAQAAIDGDDDPYNLLYRQKVLVNDRKNNKGFMKAKNGRLPKCNEGWVGNAITSGLGALGGLSQWLEAKNSSPRKTNVYKQNNYEGVSLDILSRLGINPFPITLSLRNAEARANKAIDMSGGLTTGQRTLTRLAALNNTQRAVADALQNIQMQNNNYFADYAKTALAAGAANAQRAMQANMYDEEMYAKAHAARQQGMQMGMRNIIDQSNNYWSNEFKRRQFNKMMNLYEQDVELKKGELNALLNNKGDTRTTKSSVMDNVLINRASKNKRRLRNPYAYYGTPLYHNLTGKWLSTPQNYQVPNIPLIDINTGKYI